MKVDTQKKRILGVIASLLLVATFFANYGQEVWTSFWRYRETNPIIRGRDVAARMGCFACHGPEGKDGAMNLKTGKKNLPAWDGGTHMMYVKNKKEIREYILDGFPARKKNIPAQWEKYQAAGIRMPSYQDSLFGKDLENLLIYVEAVSDMEETGDPSVERGRVLALKWDCFHCHGVAGSGGPSNPGSFSGFIPGWLGPAYNDLVQSDEELMEWIKKGKIPRLEQHPIAGTLLSRQKIKMPAYESEFNDEEIRGLMDYIKWLRKKYGSR